jgi:aminoglycoside N3'-acetyltransferase/aminopeptidase-like protein
MAWRVPRSLRTFCREILPLLHAETQGQRLLKTVDRIVETDRWNSFDRFHETTKTLVSLYEAAGAGVEVHSLPTGGRPGSGRWVIHEATDVGGATLAVVEPVREQVLDYQQNPWHVIQWSGATPEQGLRCRLEIVDSEEALGRIAAGGLAGKMVLTGLDPRPLLPQLLEKGAAGVITDRPVPNFPDALAWTKFGWGGLPPSCAGTPIVGLVLSQDEGRRLRELVQEHGPLTVEAQVDIRRYAGTHDVVSGLIRGAADPQDEVWVLAHSAEPGAHDNASGVALCVEVARVLESLIAAGRLARPRRSIRLLSAYECYGFFQYLEEVRRLQPPLAGVVVDTVGAKPEVCHGRLEWHATVPMSAGFVDRLGLAILQATLALGEPLYELSLEPFMSTSDTLIGDPKYGFPAPWLTTHHQRPGQGFDAYHSSADTLELLSPEGLALCTAAMAGYLYYLADAGTREALELMQAETRWTLAQMAESPEATPSRLRYLEDQHRTSVERLQRWLWGGDRDRIFKRITFYQAKVQAEMAERTGSATAAEPSTSTPPGSARSGVFVRKIARLPRRTALLTPDWEYNAPPELASRVRATAPGAGCPPQGGRMSPWALFWANGDRNLFQIALLLAEEYGREVKPEQVNDFFEAHAELGYVQLIEWNDIIFSARLEADLRALGLTPGMDVMVHSSLSRIGHVIGGANTVVEALLAVIGPGGTLLMPSFNHRSASVFNPLATPTTNGAIPDAMWRRPEAVRSLHPTHAVAAIGPKAEEYCRGHLEAGIWAADSPIGRLIHGGGYLLSLGVTHEASTAYHVAEISVPCSCIDQFGSTDRVVMPDGSVQEVRGLAWRSASCPVPPRRLDETLDERGLQRHGQVGHAAATLVRALDLWHVRREHLMPVCPTCTILPERRARGS